jgi:hypothetical protein
MRCVSTDDYAEAKGKTLTEMANLEPIMASAHGTTMPPATERVQTILASGARVWKHTHIAAKQPNHSRHAAQVITQVELPRYRRPRNP